MSFLLFTRLAAELQAAVLQQCETTELLNLALCSRDMNHLAVAILYRHVDLSDHNEEGLFTDYGHERMVRANNLDRKGAGMSALLFHRQELFISTILERSSYGAFVHSLTWTYFWMDEESKTDHSRLWNTFHNLNNVTSVDIYSMDQQEHQVVPPPLFPSATRIRIGGRMTYAFFRAVLALPEGIQSLDIDNVHGLGQLSDGVRLGDPDSFLDVYETQAENLAPVVRHPGPMKGHLALITGRFNKLQSLCIRSVGQDDYPDRRFSGEREQERYEEVAKFLESVQSTLESLVLEYGTEADKPFRRPCHDQSRTKHIGRPMDGRFIKIILPILSRGPWPALKTLMIVGIGGKPTQTALNRLYTPEDDSVFECAEDSLRRALGKEVLFHWEKELVHSFYLLEPIGSAYD